MIGRVRFFLNFIGEDKAIALQSHCYVLTFFFNFFALCECPSFSRSLLSRRRPDSMED